jgi:putative ABC transport system permease protein
MIRVALRGIAGRKLRTVLTATAIVLGVAMMSGAYVLTDTIDKAFNAIFVESYAGTDAVITGKGAEISFEGEQSQPPPIPENVLEQVRGVDGVEVATGSVSDFQTKLIKSDGEAIETGGAPSFAFGLETAPEYDRFNPLNLVDGRWPASARPVSSRSRGSRSTASSARSAAPPSPSSTSRPPRRSWTSAASWTRSRPPPRAASLPRSSSAGSARRSVRP